MTDTLVILNPHAGSGRGRALLDRLRPRIQQVFGDVVYAVTPDVEAVRPALEEAQQGGVRRVIGIGGDGTNHSIINALVNLQSQAEAAPIAFGSIPMGTGQDWARSLGTPLDPVAAIRWLAERTATPTDVVRITLDGSQIDYLLNIASTGLGGEVDRRVNAETNRRPWTFMQATVQSVLSYGPQLTQIEVDDHTWQEGKTYAVIVANGSTFGHGMKIAPNAQIDDGLLDVVVIKEASRLALLMALRRVYSGSHLTHAAVEYTRAQSVTITASAALPLDLDGEYDSASRLQFEVLPNRLMILR